MFETAFQVDAFQNDAFQIAAEVAVVQPPATGGAMRFGKAGSGRWIRLDPDETPIIRVAARAITAGVPRLEQPLPALLRCVAHASGLGAGQPRVGKPRLAINDDAEVLELLELLEAA